jgi:hypothetical protein
VSALLDILEERGLLSPVESPTASDPLDNPVGARQKVIKELLTTERKYVESLERLMVHLSHKKESNKRNFEMNYKQRISLIAIQYTSSSLISLNSLNSNDVF